MSSVIQSLLDNVIGDGARSTKFECAIAFNNTGLFDAEKDTSVLVKTSQFPGKTHEVIDFKFKGRTIPIKGQTKYDNTWACTFYLTQDHKLKIAFENWIESIDQQHNIKKVTDEVKKAQENNGLNNYTTTMKIKQLDFDGTSDTVVYELFNVFPKSVSAVDVDYSAVGTIMEFTVEFSYSYFNTEISKINNGSFVDEQISKARDRAEELADDIKKNLSSGFGLVKSKVGDLSNTLLDKSGLSNAAEIGVSKTKASDMASRMI